MKVNTNDQHGVIQRQKLSALKWCVLLIFGAAIVSVNHPNVARKIVAVVNKPKGIDTSTFYDDITDTEYESVNDNDTANSVSSDNRLQILDIKRINLIGERHCGTKFMTKHLEECFGDQVEVLNRYTRWKHWFQFDDRVSDKNHTVNSRNYHTTKSSLVVAMFR